MVKDLEIIIEALLFSSSAPLSIDDLKESTKKSNIQIKKSLQKIQDFYSKEDRAFGLVQTALGYQLRTKKEFSAWIAKSKKPKKHYLSKSALETLAVIIYKQPISKQEINKMRKVDSSGTIQNLLRKKLIKIAGRSDSLGKPILYATSNKLLDVLGLKKLSDMPKLNE